METRIRFNTGEIVGEFIVLNKVEFKVHKLKWL